VPEAVDPIDVVAEPSTVQVLRHDGSVEGVAFSPDGRLLATASHDRTVRVREVADGQERAAVSHDGLVLGVAFNPDRRLLATACSDQSARIWALVRYPLA
jgi:WD40 repeat protein